MLVGQQLFAAEGTAASAFLMSGVFQPVEDGCSVADVTTENPFPGETRFEMDEELIRYNAMTEGSRGGRIGGPGGISTPPSAPAGAGSPPGSEDLKVFLQRTSTADGEIGLLRDAMERDEKGNRVDENGIKWMEMVRRGVAGDRSCAALVDRPLVKALMRLTSDIMVPEVDNFTSEKRTPWGGTRIVSEMKKGLGRWREGLVVGESWEVSGHKKFPNEFVLEYAGSEVKVDVRTLQRMFSRNLYGTKAGDNGVTDMPFLLKLLNSGGWENDYLPELERILEELDVMEGATKWRMELNLPTALLNLVDKNYDEIHQCLTRLENMVGDCDEITRLRALHQKMLQRNLSVQVHPDSDYKGLKEGEHSKTEAWVIVDAERGAGIYLGLKEGVTRELFRKTLEEGGDVTQYLNFVPVKAGETYFIPAGTIHAIGAGVMLVEPQETSETTYRVYDYGRTDDKGNPRELHVKQAMDVITFDGLRGSALVDKLKRKPVRVSRSPFVRTLVDEELFRARRVRIPKGESYTGTTNGITAYLVLEGAVAVEGEYAHSEPREILKGQSFIVPDAAKAFTIKGTAHGVESVLIEVSAR